MKFLTSGKVKDVYELEDGKLLFKFSNRVSAYDVKFKDEIPKKGEVLCKFAQYWFKKLDVPNHFVERKSDTEIVVRKLNMLPIECVVRGYFYGSLVSRWKDGKISLEDDTQTDLAAKLPNPIFDPTTKSAHDMPVNREEVISQKLVTNDEYDWLSEESIKIYEKMARIADNAGYILADLKLEFGKENDTIIDVGGHIGLFMLFSEQFCHKGKIYCFEPELKNYRIFFQLLISITYNIHLISIIK